LRTIHQQKSLRHAGAFLLARRLKLTSAAWRIFLSALPAYVMKTLLALAATTLLSWAGFAPAVAAAPPVLPATANFVSERGLAFGLLLDGQPLTRVAARQIHVDRLRPGQHWADFSIATPYGPPMRFRTSVWLAPGLETSYVLVLRPGGPRLRQVGAVPLAGPVYGPGGGYPGGSYPAPLPPGAPGSNGPGGYYGNAPAPLGYPGNAHYGNPGNGAPGSYPGNGPAGGYGGAAPGYSSNGTSGYHPSNGAPGYPSSGYDPGNTPAPNGGYSPNAGGNYLYSLSPADVQNLTQELRSQPFDEERLPMVKQALAQSTVRADELAELLNTMAFDRSRIDLAKYGYAHLSDTQNFYRVYDALRYPSSIREVQQALGLPQN
jgi:hypothetical protein